MTEQTRRERLARAAYEGELDHSDESAPWEEYAAKKDYYAIVDALLAVLAEPSPEMISCMWSAIEGSRQGRRPILGPGAGLKEAFTAAINKVREAK